MGIEWKNKIIAHGIHLIIHGLWKIAWELSQNHNQHEHQNDMSNEMKHLQECVTVEIENGTQGPGIYRLG